MAADRCFLAITIFVYFSVCATQVLLQEYELLDDKDHPCVRKCNDKEPPRTCKYYWTLEGYYVLSRACYDCPFNQSDCVLPHCVSADGVSRPIKTVNRKLPGPTIQVCEGDTIEVTVDNRMEMSEGTSIHWHGILNRGSPHMDGVPMITQCPIPAHTKFTYRLRAANSGTYFWHAHAGLQQADGLFGSLIVRSPPGLEPHNLLYDHDLPEHVIVLNNWSEHDAMHTFVSFFHGSVNFNSRILIQGMDSFKEFKNSSGTSFFTPRATFTVEAGNKYRFRVINTQSRNCVIQVSIDNHRLTMIASDGSPVQPFVVDSFKIASGERYDFVLHANKVDTLRNYWFRFRGEEACYNYMALAILKYRSAPDALPSESTRWQDVARGGTLLNPTPTDDAEVEIQVTDMRALEPDDDTMTSAPNKTLYLGIDMNSINDSRFHHPVYYPFSAFPDGKRVYTAQINQISFMTPPSPPLSQFHDVAKDLYCNAESLKRDCEKEHCMCLHSYRLELGDLIEVVLVSEGKHDETDHPVHLHGHKFRVVGLQKIGRPILVEEIKQMDVEGRLNRTSTRAPLKDTVNLPSRSYIIIRFKADSPGFWLLHCHINGHMETGMNIMFQVGSLEQMPRTPNNFPTCGSWKEEPISEEEDDDEE